MNIVVTGSLGNISKPLTQLLIAQGHSVTVISSDGAKKQSIETLKAKPAIGSMKDIGFLTETFKGADAVYAMIPLSFTEPDLPAYLRAIAGNYVQALKAAKIKRVVVLSGWSADLVDGEKVEDVFNVLEDVSITYLRPAYFYSNFFQSMDMIKGKGMIGKFLALRYLGIGSLLTGKTGLLMGNFGGDDKIVFVAPSDIADAAAEELLKHPEQPTIRYVGSEEMTCNEAATIIGKAIGKPWLKWILISDKEMLQGLKMAKLPQSLAETLVEMQAVMHSGKALENFHKNQPKMGKTKLADFAKEFATVYHQK
jgi:uncharacterized protein YbjT (DUF2867 family)